MNIINCHQHTFVAIAEFSGIIVFNSYFLLAENTRLRSPQQTTSAGTLEKNSTMIQETPIEPIETPKNKWLYTDDNFGKLEKDLVFESKTYQSGIKLTKIDSFKIIPVKKTKRNTKK